MLTEEELSELERGMRLLDETEPGISHEWQRLFADSLPKLIETARRYRSLRQAVTDARVWEEVDDAGRGMQDVRYNP